MSAEKLGIPAVAVITDRFEDSARAMALANGMPDYPFAVITHPIAGNGDDELRDKAEHAVRLLSALLLLPIALATLAATVAAQTAPGGFLETAVSTAVRPRVTPTLPSRGSFAFPAPYNTTGIRLTNSSDCGGADCVDYVGYSYWR